MWETTCTKLCVHGRIMKLLKPEGCSFSSGGGNVKKWTMIVEVHGIPVWTRVRFPPGPFIVVRRDPSKMGGFLMTNCGKEGPIEDGRIPYHAGRRPRTKFVYYSVCYLCVVMRRGPPQVGGVLMTNCGKEEGGHRIFWWHWTGKKVALGREKRFSLKSFPKV